ncbi:hypothetical protein INT43_007274, partial [Umbelopsis isabellina]
RLCSISMLYRFCFDVFGTIVNWRVSMVKALDEYIPPESRPNVDSEVFVNRWRQGYMQAMARFSQQTFDQNNYPSLDDIHFETLESLLSEYKLQDMINDQNKVDLNMHWHQLMPWKDSPAGMAGLQNSAITATLSNGTVRLLVDLARYGDLRFDVIFSGESFLAFKPNPAMYQGAPRLLNLKPDEICMVAAHDIDLQYAKKNGLVTAFLYRPGEGHDEKEITTDLPHIDICITELTQLSDLYNKVKAC